MPTDTSDNADAFAQYVDGVILHYAPRILGFLLLITAVWWPTDALVFGHTEGMVDAVRQLRLQSLAVGSLCLASMLWSKQVRARPTTYALVLLVVSVAVFGHGIGTMTPIAQTLLPYSAFCLFYPVPMPIGLKPRIAVTLLVLVVLLGSFVWGGGTQLASTQFPLTISYLVFCSMGCVALGHLVGKLMRRNFDQSRALEALNASLGDQVAAQTRSLRTLAEQLTGAVESERARVALDLHDNLGQHLTAVRMAAKLARKRLEPSVSAEAKQPLTMLEHMVEGTHEVLREIVWGLRPGSLDSLGLAPTIESLARRVEAHGPLKLELSVRDDGSAVAPAVSLACFRVAQEALSNATRHSGAQSAEVSLAIAKGGVDLVVSDDGAGLSAEATTTGTGLTSMRERARAVGGGVTIEPGPSRGVRVHLRVPAQESA